MAIAFSRFRETQKESVFQNNFVKEPVFSMEVFSTKFNQPSKKNLNVIKKTLVLAVRRTKKFSGVFESVWETAWNVEGSESAIHWLHNCVKKTLFCNFNSAKNADSQVAL